MRRAIRTILIFVTTTILLASCAKNADDKDMCFNPIEVKASCNEDGKKANVSVKNTSNKDYANVTISVDCKKVNYGTIKSGETSCSESYEKIYRYASVKLQIEGKDYQLQPVDFVGETPLVAGKHTYAISISGPDNRLAIHTTKN